MKEEEILNQLNNEDIDSMFVYNPENIKYISDFYPSSFAYLIIDEEPVLYVNSIDKESAENHEKCKAIKDSFLSSINELHYSINGAQEYCLPSTINISFHGVDAEGIFLAIKDDYAFSNGSACTSGSHKPSYVLTAMGLDDARINEAVRISWNQNTVVDFSFLVNYIKSITE